MEFLRSKIEELEAQVDLQFGALAEGSKCGETAGDIQRQINLSFKC